MEYEDQGVWGGRGKEEVKEGKNKVVYLQIMWEQVFKTQMTKVHLKLYHLYLKNKTWDVICYHFYVICNGY